MKSHSILLLYLVFFIIQYVWERFLEIKNIRYVKSQDKSPPSFIAGSVSSEEYKNSIDYTLTKQRFSIFSSTASSIFLLLLILSGFLGYIDSLVAEIHLHRYTTGVLYLVIIVLIFRLFSLPFSLFDQFNIEERFGFNKMKLGLFFLDLIKGLILSFLLLIPLSYLLFFFMDKAGSLWWIYAFGVFTLVQFFIMLIYPTFIAPIFNKFTPLEEGPLRDRIFALADKLGFRTKGIFVMNGSKRSKHSNAYFTGIGKTKRIVLYDTLIQSMSEDELIAVLAHEIGHEKKQHTKKIFTISLIGSVAGFFILSLLLQYPPFFNAFGFKDPSYHAVLVLLMFCSGPFTFFLTPLFSLLSRKYEYEADNFAVKSIGDGENMKSALISIYKENLSNLTPHPLYSFYHYAHPTLAERIKAIDAVKL